MILWRLPTDRYTFYGSKHWEPFNERCSVFVRGIVHCCCKKKKTISCIAYPALWSIHTLHAWTGLRLLNSKHNYYKLGSACAKKNLFGAANIWIQKVVDGSVFIQRLKTLATDEAWVFPETPLKNTTYTEALFKSFNTIQSYEHSSNLSVFTS